MHELLVEKLYNEYSIHGFISEQYIFGTLQEDNIPLLEVEYICDQLLSKGVVILDVDDEDDDNSDSDYDRSNTDYEAIYSTACNIDPSLKEFINYIRSIQPPQNREWMNLLPQAQNGNKYAKNRMFEMYMRVVVKMAMSFSARYELPLTDTIQDGMVGLYTAIDKFEFGKQDMFTTYFPFWVRQNIMREAATRNPTVYIPVHVKDRLFSLYDIEDQHSCEECVKHVACPNLIAEIAHTLECDTDEALRLYNYLIPFQSVEELMETNEDIFSDNGFLWEDIVNKTEKESLHTAISQVFSTLSERERYVISQRYGLLTGEPLTLEQVGNAVGVTRERIRQIEAKAIRKLQHHTRIKKLKELY